MKEKGENKREIGFFDVFGCNDFFSEIWIFSNVTLTKSSLDN